LVKQSDDEGPEGYSESQESDDWRDEKIGQKKNVRKKTKK
jgi:hypothetical protein